MYKINIFLITILIIKTCFFISFPENVKASDNNSNMNSFETMFVIRGISFIIPLSGIQMYGFLDKSICFKPENLIKDGLPQYRAKRDDWVGKNREHSGYDIYFDKKDVLASGSGRVVGIKRGSRSGLQVKIKHRNHINTLYIHLAEVFVQKGQIVKQGDIIGKIDGAAGNAKAPQLHFEINIDKHSFDPLILIENYYYSNEKINRKISICLEKLQEHILERDKYVKKFINKEVPNNRGKQKYIFYKVKKGDSLWSIGNKFHISIKKIQLINKVRDKKINKGQVLKIPQN